MNLKKAVVTGIVALSVAVGLTACEDTDANVVSENISTAADQFEITRRIVFVNNFTGEYLLEVIGSCNIVDDGNQLEVTCKVADGYKKHFLGKNANSNYFVEQIDAARVSDSFYRVVYKPSTILPDIEIR